MLVFGGLIFLPQSWFSGKTSPNLQDNKLTREQFSTSQLVVGEGIYLQKNPSNPTREASHEKEQRARETIQNLKSEITKLGRLVEQGVMWGVS